jgi:excinuclease ABC subunit C
MHAHVRAHAEHRPGVYRFRGRNGTVVYVGTSRRLRARLLSYFTRQRRRAKAPRILRHAVTLEWEYTADAFGALLLELREIKRHRPLFNAVHVSDEWPRGWIALTRAPVPGLRVVRDTDDPHAARAWGPFRHVGHLADAVRTLAELTGVRDCALETTPPQWRTAVHDGARTVRAPFAFADTRAGRATDRVAGCLRHALGSCPGMCIGHGNATDYAHAVERARAFLDGAQQPLLRQLAADMHASAERLEFERAAALRDRLERLQSLARRLQRFHADVDRLTLVYRGEGDAPRLYLIRRGTVRADLAMPHDADGWSGLDTLLDRTYASDDPPEVPTHALDEFALVARWFRAHPEALTTHAWRPGTPRPDWLSPGGNPTPAPLHT